MNIIEIINKKRLNLVLTKEEIEYVISSYLNNQIKDYQMSSLLMAIVINGMTDEEVIYLTDVILNSGDIIDLSYIDGIKVDKHSTGGVGDKTTLVLAPLVASTGVVVAKMSGRGLGHTGGTIDKLESIQGFNVNLSETEFKNQIKNIKVAIASQTQNLVPADKKIYSLRDVTGTVSSIPLIASSIMSKKIASGADNIVIDVKVGAGALVDNTQDAEKLASLMIKIGKHYNKKVICVLTNMNQPLGSSIGNGLEIIESIECLKGNGPSDLEKLVLTLGSYMVSLGKNISLDSAYNELENNLKNQLGLDKFKELIQSQNGDFNKIKIAPKIFSVKSIKQGYINKIDTLTLGNLAKKIGAGRNTAEDSINYGVGFVLTKKIGDYVEMGEELLKVYLDEIDIEIKSLLDCYSIVSNEVINDELIYKIIE